MGRAAGGARLRRFTRGDRAPRQAPRIAARHPTGSEGTGFWLGAWLQRVVTNLAIDRLRRTRRLTHGELPEQEDEAPLADAVVEAREDGSLARALIAALPDRQRAAIVLTYYEELPNAQAAAAMDMNIKDFESLLHRARTGLRQAFAEQGGVRVTNVNEHGRSGDPIMPLSALARAQSGDMVPSLSPGFGDRVIAAAEAQTAPLPALRRRPGRWSGWGGQGGAWL